MLINFNLAESNQWEPGMYIVRLIKENKLILSGKILVR